MNDPHELGALPTHPYRDQNIDLVETSTAQIMPPDRGGPGDHAPRAGVQEGRHRSLVRGDRSSGGCVDPGQDPLPPSSWLREVVDPPAAESAVEHLAPADHSELLKQQVGQPLAVIYGFDRHANTVSPHTDKRPARQLRPRIWLPVDCAIDPLYWCRLRNRQDASRGDWTAVARNAGWWGAT